MFYFGSLLVSDSILMIDSLRQKSYNVTWNVLLVCEKFSCVANKLFIFWYKLVGFNDRDICSFVIVMTAYT